MAARLTPAFDALPYADGAPEPATAQAVQRLIAAEQARMPHRPDDDDARLPPPSAVFEVRARRRG
jgi:hypothetical protein